MNTHVILLGATGSESSLARTVHLNILKFFLSSVRRTKNRCGSQAVQIRKTYSTPVRVGNMALLNSFTDFLLVVGGDLVVAVKHRIILIFANGLLKAGNLFWRDASPARNALSEGRIPVIPSYIWGKSGDIIPMFPGPALKLFCLDPRAQP